MVPKPSLVTLDALAERCGNDSAARTALAGLRSACLDYAEHVCELRLRLIALHLGVVTRQEVEPRADAHLSSSDSLTAAAANLAQALAATERDASGLSQLAGSWEEYGRFAVDEAFELAGWRASVTVAEGFAPLSTAIACRAPSVLTLTEGAAVRVERLATLLGLLCEFRLLRILRGSAPDQRREILVYAVEALRLVRASECDIAGALAAKRTMLRWSHVDILSMARADIG